MKILVGVFIGLILCIYETRAALTPPIFGLYHGAAPNSPNNLPEYEAWLGRSVSYATDFMPIDGGWAALEGQSWQLGPWSAWVNAQPNRFFVLSIPMVPQYQEKEIINGSLGFHNSTFLKLANNLKSYNLSSNTILRIGWEMNGDWQPWKASTNTSAWVKFFKIIVTVMRTVAPFKVIWNPNAGYAETDSTIIWPGDQYVDYIGIDTYDADFNTALPSYNLGTTQRGAWSGQYGYMVNDIVDYNLSYYQAIKNISAGASGTQNPSTDTTNWRLAINSTQLAKDRTLAWADYYSGYHGLLFFVAFAKNHSKPIALCEWGVWLQTHGGGDNPYYIQQMYDFIYNTSNNVYYYSYFDVYAGDGDHRLAPQGNVTGTLPLSSAKFKQLFGVTPSSSATSSPGLSSVTSSPSPINNGGDGEDGGAGCTLSPSWLHYF